MEFKKGQILQAKTDNLWPTQPRLGLAWVFRKVKKISKMDYDERHEYLSENPIPVVVGPEGRLYMVDHHHLARAVIESDHSKVYIQVIENYSNLSQEEFWKKMKKNHFVYLRDDVTESVLSPEDLPEWIEDLKDDPFRSLAGFLRDLKGFQKKLGAYFIEFIWAGALRKHFKKMGYALRLDGWEDWEDREIKYALDFSFSAEAINLPGSYAGQMCESVLVK